MADVVAPKVQWPNYSSSNPKPASGQGMGKDDFLKILIAQLKNQDPTQPLQDREFIAQMAQFTSVEQLAKMSDEMKLLRQSMGFATGLIGKTIEWEQLNAVTNVKEKKTGVVSSLTFKEGKQFADVDGASVQIDQILRVWEGSAPGEPGENGDAGDGEDA
ncbi:flagellar hook capping FlgD N-terminal domain-containing protein [Paenibacillus thermoaerophilus]|uniref:Flagellar hook capping FlgD N-terminal domain-containing protein n=1 Tax=Paenibacillus thermoaerophilus TaxID=1215385 RepID=A0ABW2V2U9_9BACL|nr:flagellar hook capping FlgD N-terminal domain-containing protein [Paenibacillus thermoaerophilus]TMV13799.1 flagellar hook capping protein [Paenibacillus thermoaerophilus]